MAWDIRVDTREKSMAIVGELTIFSVLDIRSRLLEVLVSLDEVNVDLGEVTEVDTAGLQLMLLAKRKAGKTVRFCNHSDEVLRLLDLANVGQTLGDPLILKAH
jgi:anti-sigma B factor antagonist